MEYIEQYKNEIKCKFDSAPQWHLDILDTTRDILVDFSLEICEVECNSCKKDCIPNEIHYHYVCLINGYGDCGSNFCINCINDNLQELYSNDRIYTNIFHDDTKWCIVCCRIIDNGCLTCNTPDKAIEYIKNNYKYVDISKYTNYFVTDGGYTCDIVNKEKPKVLTPVNEISKIFTNTYKKLDIDFLVHVDIEDSSILDLVSFTNLVEHPLVNGGGYFLINANPNSKDYKKIAIYIMDHDYRYIIKYIDLDIDMFTIQYNDFIRSLPKISDDEYIKIYNDDYDKFFTEFSINCNDYKKLLRSFCAYYIFSNDLKADFG